MCICVNVLRKRVHYIIQFILCDPAFITVVIFIELILEMSIFGTVFFISLYVILIRKLPVQKILIKTKWYIIDAYLVKWMDNGYLYTMDVCKAQIYLFVIIFKWEKCFIITYRIHKCCFIYGLFSLFIFFDVLWSIVLPLRITSIFYGKIWCKVLFDSIQSSAMFKLKFLRRNSMCFLTRAVSLCVAVVRE